MDKETDLYQRFHWDAHLDRPVIETFQNIQPILDQNKRMFNDTPETPQRGEKWRLSAQIPAVVAHMWINECKRRGINFWGPEGMKFLKSRLNDREFKYFKTHNSKI